MSTSLPSMPGAGTPAAFESPELVVPGLPAAACTSDAVLPLEDHQAFTGSRGLAGLAHEQTRAGARRR